MTRRSRESRHLTAISLFTGAGGMDYGFEAAGFRTLLAIECDHDCCDTLRSNRRWQVEESTIEGLSSERIRCVADIQRGDLDLLFGGPPCQPFSKSAYWSNGDTRRLKDPRARTLHEYMRCVNDLLPKVFVLENVYGIRYSGKEEGFRLLIRLTDEINRREGTKYVLSWKVLNAAEYGVPQLRERFFLVGDRQGRAFRFPKSTCSLEAGANGALQPITAWETIGDYAPERDEHLAMRGQWAELLPSIPEGENYLWHTKRKGGLPLFGWRSRYWSFLLKLAKDRPSWTIQAQPGPAIGPFHWTNRLLSVREMARLQTFPDDIEFTGSRSSVQKQIGNAVPPLLSEVLGQAITEQLFDRSARSPLKLTIARKRPIPPPEQPHKVPPKFLHLVGDYPDYDQVRRARRKTTNHSQPAMSVLNDEQQLEMVLD
jgi:DNA (cytosine-5)-methyltransferase 1